MSKRNRKNFKSGKSSNSRSTDGAVSWLKIRNLYLPSLLIIFMIAVVSAIAVFGYRKATYSPFFNVDKISFNGLNRVSREELERIVRTKIGRNTVWYTDLDEVRVEIEKLSYVKDAAVSRVLPDGLVITVEERIPRAPVSVQSGDFWVDEDGRVLGKVSKDEKRPALFLRGWDESRTERAQKENSQRVKLFQNITEDFAKFGITGRVTDLNLSDIQDVQVSILDSDMTVQIMLGREDFGKRLEKALRMIEGKGQKIERLISHGTSVSAQYREGGD